jgi:hypothetical protein
VNGVASDFDIPVGAGEIRNQLVVIPGNVNNARALARFAQNFLDNVVVLLRPVPPTAHRPDIDQVAHNVQSLEIVRAQKIEQHCGIAAARTQVRIGDPCGAITSGSEDFLS